MTCIVSGLLKAAAQKHSFTTVDVAGVVRQVMGKDGKLKRRRVNPDGMAAGRKVCGACPISSDLLYLRKCSTATAPVHAGLLHCTIQGLPA